MRHAVTCCCLMILIGSKPAAAELPALADIPGAEAGLVVMVNPADHRDAVRIADGGRHLVCVLSADPAHVQALDDAFIETQVHPVADARRWWDASRLPFRDRSVNVLVVEASRAPDLDEKEIRRVIAPDHGVALVLRDGSWQKLRQDRPEAMDVWLGWQRDARGHMGSDDTLVGPVNSYQFVAGPRTARFTPAGDRSRRAMGRHRARSVQRRDPARPQPARESMAGRGLLRWPPSLHALPHRPRWHRAGPGPADR